MKETFYCRLQTVVLSQLCVVYAIICEGRRGSVLIRAVKWQQYGRLLTSVKAKLIEWCTQGCVCGGVGAGVTVELWSPAETQTQKTGHKKHFYFTWPVISSIFSACGLQPERVFSPSFKSIWRFMHLKKREPAWCWLSGAQNYHFSQWGHQNKGLSFSFCHVCILNINTHDPLRKSKTYKILIIEYWNKT